MPTDARIKKVLLDGSYASAEDIKKAEEYAKLHKTSIVDFLFAEKLISRSILGQAMAEFFKVSFLDLKKQKIEENVFHLIPELVARSRGVIAVSRTSDGVKIGMTNPNDLEIIHLIEKRVADRVLPYYIMEQDLIDSLLLYKESLREEFEKIIKQLSDQTLSREEQDETTVKIVDMLFQYGHQSKASDIHIEPYTKKVVVRFRIDGVLHDVLDIPKELSDLILTRVKILAKMRTDQHRMAQDGKLRFQATNEKVDVRVSVVPVTEGENTVMRLLSSASRQFSLAELGLLDISLRKVKKAIKNPHGMVLSTGPTGSGKTTTLYAVMKMLNKRDVHVSTIEDPVEYDIEGISQIQVNTKTNLTFAKGLRAIVRQDPDIIMIGEIRDEETADIAVNSALTGHLVLSTLHTNDAATTLPRLLDMKVEPFLVASTINLIIAQRLVRKICQKCRVSYFLDDKEIKSIEAIPQVAEIYKKKTGKELSKLRFYKSQGCKVCGNSGYSGRIGIFEVLEMSEEIKKLVLKRASSNEIVKMAKENGMITMIEDGADKTLNGVTTIEEVLRVTRG